MKLYLNQQELHVGSRAMLRDVLTGQNLIQEGITVAVNNCVIPSTEWTLIQLKDGDKVIVMAEPSFR